MTWAVFLVPGASDVDLDESNDYELNLYGGYSAAMGDSGWTYDALFLSYLYPDRGGVEGFPEVSLGLSFDGFSALIAYTWENYGLGEDAIDVNVGGEYEVSNGDAIHPSVGYYDFDDPAHEFFTGARSNSID